VFGLKVRRCTGIQAFNQSIPTARAMAGPNLEIFRFGFYVFFPIAIMLHYGNPDWFERHVIPARDRMFPPLERTNRPPTDPHDIKEEIARMRAERLARDTQRRKTNETSSSNHS